MVHRSLLALTVIIAAASFAEGEAPLYIEGGTLIDGSGAAPRANPGILLRDGVIESVGEKPPAGVARISAEGQWILPGMFDLHAHITFKLAGARDLEDDVVNALRSERFLEAYQRIGVTTVQRRRLPLPRRLLPETGAARGTRGRGAVLRLRSAHHDHRRARDGVPAARAPGLRRRGGRSLGVPKAGSRGGEARSRSHQAHAALHAARSSRRWSTKRTTGSFA